MQSLATYSLVHKATSVKGAKGMLSQCSACVEQWLAGKGKLADGQLILRKGGRKAGVTVATYDSSQGESKEWELTEPLTANADAEFRTNLVLV